MSKHQEHFCPFCRTEIRRYRFALNSGLLLYLQQLYNVGGTGETSSMGLTASQYTNYTKLQHWGLIEPMLETERQNAARGWWRITPRGEDFVKGLVSLPRGIHTVEGVFDGYTDEDDAVYIYDVLTTAWRIRQDYIDDMEVVAPIDGQQLGIF